MSRPSSRVARLMRANSGVSLTDGELPPPRVSWLHPVQLLRTGYQAWVSTIGSGILDRREVLAALASHSPSGATAGIPAAGTPPHPFVIPGNHIDGFVVSPTHAEERSAGQQTADARHESRPQGPALSLDFVADVGDSWEATYATASLLVDDDLMKRLPESEQHHAQDFKRLPQSDLLVFGGDLVYPMASREEYRRRFLAPLVAAAPPLEKSRPYWLYAIPGNHDWYDGLTNFVRTLCQGDRIGNWQLTQRRSYFAVKLVKGWWLWGIDIALDTRIDAPQQQYFRRVLNSCRNADGWAEAERFVPGDRIILCTAKPAWVNISRYSSDAYENLVAFIEMIEDSVREVGAVPENSDDARRRSVVPLVLTGDLHHYSRYEGEERQLVIAGGGGAYLMGTHFLPRRVAPLASSNPAKPGSADDRSASQAAGRKRPRRVDAESLPASQLQYRLGPKTYPDFDESRWLALGALRLPLRIANWPFCLLIGIVAWFMAQPPDPAYVRPPLVTRYVALVLPDWLWMQPELATVTVLLMISVIGVCIAVAAFINDDKPLTLTGIWGALHGLGQIWLAFASTWLLQPVNRLAHVGPFSTGFYLWAVLNMVVAGGLGGALVGLYLVISDRYFGMHHNEVFAAQSLIDYRNFVRLLIAEDGNLVMIPIGLRRVPRRWRRKMDGAAADPLYEPANDILAPHIIEGPLTFDVSTGRWR